MTISRKYKKREELKTGRVDPQKYVQVSKKYTKGEKNRAQRFSRKKLERRIQIRLFINK